MRIIKTENKVMHKIKNKDDYLQELGEALNKRLALQELKQSTLEINQKINDIKQKIIEVEGKTYQELEIELINKIKQNQLI